ncbi:MAG: NapC/NirT family cytochrome c [Phycisphaerales bacterium]|nr:MAG: NapC/NirT family cytochrome c [Phycisphaerales bacterium]
MCWYIVRMLCLSAKAACWIGVFLAGVIFAVLCFIALGAAMAPVSTSEYCGSKCHEMTKAYLSWELSPHGANAHGIRVECIDCHLPPKEKYFTHVAAKAYAGAKDTYKHYFGGPYDAEQTRKRVLNHLPSQRCLHCHDHLLDKPGSSAARIAHTTALAQPDAAENRCVQCHEDAGHQRRGKLFSQ